MSAPINVRDLVAGSSVVLASGAEVEIVDNPQDGIWLFARYLSSPRDPALVGREEMIFAPDVVAVAEAKVLSSLKLEDSQRCLVLYGWSHEPARRCENLRCLDSEARTVWSAELPANTGVDCFVGMRLQRGAVIATTWSGYALTLDVDTGRIIVSEFVK